MELSGKVKKIMLAATLLLIGATVFVATGKFSQTEAQPSDPSETVNKLSNNEYIAMEKLTKEAFLKKVFNYEQNKEWKYEGELPCLIDFYADWCGPCKMVHPVLVELSKEYEGKINIYQIDTEAEQELAAAFGIRSIPSLLFCPVDGQPQMAQGALPKATLKRAIEDILLKQTTNVTP